LTRQCAGIKRDGGRCTVVVGPSQTHCYQHDPTRAEERRRNASRGGRSKGNARVRELHRRLEELAKRVISGDLETSRGAVACQLISAQIRLLEAERRFEEADVRAEFEELKRELGAV
jgi:hypothetical protein